MGGLFQLIVILFISSTKVPHFFVYILQDISGDPSTATFSGLVYELSDM